MRKSKLTARSSNPRTAGLLRTEVHVGSLYFRTCGVCGKSAHICSMERGMRVEGRREDSYFCSVTATELRLSAVCLGHGQTTRPQTRDRPFPKTILFSLRLQQSARWPEILSVFRCHPVRAHRPSWWEQVAKGGSEPGRGGVCGKQRHRLSLGV